MTTMATIGQFLVLWALLWLVLLAASYALTALVVEPLGRLWQERAEIQTLAKDLEASKREMARIDGQAAEAFVRIGQAYLQAQTLIRQEARRREGP